MMKKFVVIPVLSLLLIYFHSFALAATSTPSIVGTYQIGGKMNIILKAKYLSKSFLDNTLNITDLALAGETFVFSSDGTFSDGFKILTGIWHQTGTKFTVDIDVESLLSSLSKYGLAGVEKSGFFTGSINPKTGNISGKFNVIIDISGSSTGEQSRSSINLDGTSLTLSGTYTRSPLTLGMNKSSNKNKNALQERLKALARTIKEEILSVLSQ